MAKNQTRERVKAYVVARLRAEEQRGYQARVVAKTGIESSTLSNVIRHGTKVGPDVVAHAAAFWDMTPQELEDLALGRSRAVAAKYDIPIETLLRRLSLDEGLPGLRAAINGPGGRRWRTSTVLRALSPEWESGPDGRPVDGWEALLDSIESGELEKVAGGAKDAISAAKKQTRRRLRIP